MGSWSVRIVWMLALAACGARPADRPQPPPTAMLLEAGSEPRQRLTYAPPLHLRERVAISQKVRVENHFTNTVLEQGTRSADSPTLHTQIALEASEGVGDVIITMTIEHSEVGEDFIDPRLRDAVVREAALLDGLRAWWHVAPSGAISGVELAKQNASPKIKSRLSELADKLAHARVVFPDVAIGAGAKWQVIEQRRSAGAIWHMTSTYQLRELSADSAVIDVTMAASANEQTLRAEPNASTKLTSGTMTGTGQWRVPVHGIAVVGSAQTAGETNLLIVDHRKRVQSTLKLDSFTEVKRIDEPATVSGDPAVAP